MKYVMEKIEVAAFGEVLSKIISHATVEYEKVLEDSKVGSKAGLLSSKTQSFLNAACLQPHTENKLRELISEITGEEIAVVESGGITLPTPPPLVALTYTRNPNSNYPGTFVGVVLNDTTVLRKKLGDQEHGLEKVDMTPYLDLRNSPTIADWTLIAKWREAITVEEIEASSELGLLYEHYRFGQIK